MSWLFGEIVKTKNSFSGFNNKIKNDIHHSFSNENINVLAGGNSNNLFSFKKSNTHYFVSGIGITTKNGFSKVMDANEWKETFSMDIENVLNMDGHFVIIKVKNESVSIYTDKLGLRDIYIKEFDDRIVFSTKIEWFTYFDTLELDYNVFGSRWLLHNQISHKSVFKNSTRLLAGKSATINVKNNCSIAYNDHKIEYSRTPITIDDYEERLLSLVNLKVRDAEKLSLSLSGGMDSRVLFSLLVNNRKEFFETHSFGNPNHPDCVIAKRMVDHLNIHHYLYDGTSGSTDEIISDLKTYTVDNIVNNAASAVLQLNNYKFLTDRNLIVVDGAPGELWRHEYFFKMLLKGRKVLLSRNIEKIIPFLLMPRADIFTEEITLQMKEGLSSQFEEVFESLPEINEKNIREWLDLLAIRTRVPNYIGHEQSRLDGLITGVMPFAQISLLSNLFSLDANEKKNARLFRNIIKQNSPKLAEYPLVKGTSQHPFYLNTFLSRVWPRVSSKIGNRYNEISNTDIILNKLKEYIYDLVNSKIIVESSNLEYDKIKKIVDDYYINGQNGYSLDWLLSFIVFNDSIYKK